jgi:hypothetical protein
MLHGKVVVHAASVISSIPRFWASISMKGYELVVIDSLCEENPGALSDIGRARVNRKSVGRHKRKRSKRYAGDPKGSQDRTRIAKQAVLPNCPASSICPHLMRTASKSR